MLDLGKKEDSGAEVEVFRQAFILKILSIFFRMSDKQFGHENYPRLTYGELRIKRQEHTWQ